MPMNPRLLRPTASGFNPRQISGLALWLDAADGSTLFQNSDGTAPATATSDPVGYWRDKSGTGHFSQANATARPVVGSQNGRKTVAFDGVNDFMTAVNPLPTSMPLTFFVAQRIVAGTSFGMTYTMATEFNVRQAGGGSVLAIIPGTAITGTSRTGSSDILSITYPSSGSNTFFVNGARFPLEDTGTRPGLTGTHAIGVRRATDGTLTFYANVQVAEILAYNAALTASQRQQVERYLAAKWGITLAPQVSNADAQDWVNRVYSNGGTVSTSTANAVNSFCNAIDAAGIRDRFYRLNLFCGSNLNAALVPLYRGQSRTGTQYGNTTDTNVGPFVSGDYTLTGGLNANGSSGSSSKYLDTGLAPDDLPALSSVHLAAWKGAGSIGGSTIALIGSRTSTQFWYVRQTAPTDTLSGNIGHGAFATGASADTTAGLVTITRNTSGLVIYKDTTSVATDGARTPTANANDFTVFAFRNTDGTVSANVAWPYAMYGYSAGVHLSSADVTAYHAAFAAFNTAMGRA
jgi:hypothetical protein